MTLARRVAGVAVILYVLLVSMPAVHAQWWTWIVFDPTNRIQTQATRMGLQQSLQWLNQQLDRLEQMSRRLSLYTSLARYRAPGAPAWRTHDTSATYAGPFLSSLTYGDSSGEGYQAIRRPVGALAPARPLSPQVEATLRSQLASLDAADSIITAGADQAGKLRRHGRDVLAIIGLIEQIVTDGNPLHSATAVLDKISTGSYVRMRQGQTRQQLILSLLQMELLSTKRRRDANAAATNGVLERLQDDGARTRALYAGTSDALASWHTP